MKIEKFFIKPIFKILCLMFNNPTQEFYEKRIAESTKVSVGACNKYMKKLSEIEFLLKEKRGKMNFYKLNRENPLVKQLKILFTLDSSLMREIAEKIDGKAEVFLYGSFARGEDVEESDLDILLISGKEERTKIITTLRNIGRKYGKNVRVAGFTRKEWVEMKKKDPAFYERVEKDKIKLV